MESEVWAAAAEHRARALSVSDQGIVLCCAKYCAKYDNTILIWQYQKMNIGQFWFAFSPFLVQFLKTKNTHINKIHPKSKNKTWHGNKKRKEKEKNIEEERSIFELILEL